MENAELTAYINKAIDRIVSHVLRRTLLDPKEAAFLLRYRMHGKRAMKRRTAYEEKGLHIPAFLISSITNACNLFCKGCYARNNGICGEGDGKQPLTAAQWEDIFAQASALGIGFHLLAGGEPLMRRDVIEKASAFGETIFPIFTNGILIDDTYCSVFDKNRNLIPVLSIEGSREATDSRRGEGVYRQLTEKMALLKRHKILFGVSVTVTTENLGEISGADFIETMRASGCRVVFFTEYVPVDGATAALALTEKERGELERRQYELRRRLPSVLFLSFPGDEKYMGGCLAAGRGFLHINPYGEAEACPFSPYSDRSLRDFTLLEVLQSPFFKRLQEQSLVGGEHTGGCALFEQRDAVAKALNVIK